MVFNFIVHEIYLLVFAIQINPIDGQQFANIKSKAELHDSWIEMK